jgi:hypothetical protein
MYQLAYFANTFCVDSKMMFSEDFGSCVSAWKNPSRMRGCKWDLLKVRKGKYKGGILGPGGVHQQREHAFLFQVLNPWEVRPRRFPPNNE